ncbi:hypothetical protein BI364_09720 [Acidihalobacter yilgarnensis]|uniref:GP-PDE domain-containing protein n=1 Tax=Acidihalobacter yilgarnensis TaxID=2819280 RepID=A0A1D8IP60_9GAMM|nr:glycerophosphodiester phosphodiesterase family protein [Acidihalobacter yilgarnensis]AOU98195.1 hypothetical protein BI364_09720 [Acidihalobacter yilgarnensis]
MKKYRFIAHRGDREFFPENTLAGFASALKLGADGIEFDVQIAADGEAVISHDDYLDRCCGISGSILDSTKAQLERISAHEPARFGEQYSSVCLPMLIDAINLFNQHEYPEIFVEIKEESIVRHGWARVLKSLSEVMCRAEFSWTLISFDDEIIRQARVRLGWKIGWVLSEDEAWDESRLRALGPDYVFASLHALESSSHSVWSGSWRWVIYGVNHPDDVIYLEKLDVFDYETDRLGFMLDAMRN